MPREPSRRINLMKRFDRIGVKRVGDDADTECRTKVYYKAGGKKIEPMAYTRSVKEITPEKQKIMRELAAKGVNVERIIGVSKDVVATEPAGKTLGSKIRKMGRNEKIHALKSAAEQLGKMNALGYWHGHARLDNITWDGHKACIIDFTFALRFEPGDTPSDLTRFLISVHLYDESGLKNERLGPGDYKKIQRTYTAQFPKAKGRAIYAAMLAKVGWKHAKDYAKGVLKR